MAGPVFLPIAWAWPNDSPEAESRSAGSPIDPGRVRSLAHLRPDRVKDVCLRPCRIGWPSVSNRCRSDPSGGHEFYWRLISDYLRALLIGGQGEADVRPLRAVIFPNQNLLWPSPQVGRARHPPGAFGP